MHLSDSIEKKLYAWKAEKSKRLAILVDPDTYGTKALHTLISLAQISPPDLFLVGGSLVVSNRLEQTVDTLQAAAICPVVLFPGSNLHLTPKADGVLFLSLISGRNAEFLIGQHVVAAPQIAQMQLEPIPTGYMLVESGNSTTVAYMSNTTPIPAQKTSVAVATALAGTMLGLRVLYLDAGSGAQQTVPISMVQAVKSAVKVPIWVGGGIRSVETAHDFYKAGADLLVVGNHMEENPHFLADLSRLKLEFEPV